MKALQDLKTVQDFFALAPQLGLSVMPATFVVIEGNNVRINTTDGLDQQRELKIALREVKMKIGEARLIKKTIAEFKRQRRSEYTSYVRQRGSMFRGGGGLGQMIRIFTGASRDKKRANLDRDLQPFEHGQAVADAAMRALQHMELQIKAHIH